MTRAYYNEIEPFAARWLRNLIERGVLPAGDVDERDIRDVRPGDLRGYGQCHFFAGIGVWAYALRLARWPDDRPVWTGSCPCQPFSQAGRGAGMADERHLWPHWHHLIRECRPAVVFGEQVASKASDPWIDLVQDDLEALGYAVGAVPVPAAGVGAPHIRDRMWWVADAAAGGRREQRDVVVARQGGHADGDGDAFGGLVLANDDGLERYQRVQLPGNIGGTVQQARRSNGALHSGLADTEGTGLHQQCGAAGSADGARRSRPTEQFTDRSRYSRVADTDGRHASAEGLQRGGQHGQQPEDGGYVSAGRTGPLHGFWRDADWLLCRDGKWRPVEPGLEPLAHGAAARVGRLRAYGNAIVAPLAAEFIGAYLDARGLDPASVGGALRHDESLASLLTRAVRERTRLTEILQ